MRGWTVLVLATAAAVLAAAPARAELPVVVGEHVSERFETPHPYPSSGAAQPMLSWTDVVEFPGATFIAIHFERMELAPGDLVVVRSPDGAQTWTYTRFGRHDLGIAPDGFFAAHIVGDAAVIELFTVGEPGGWGYAVDKYGRGYNDDEIRWFWSQGLGEEMRLPAPSGMTDQICGTDDTEEAACYQASEPAIYDASRAVARLLLNGIEHCTGWLVGSAGHLMTNQHCIGLQATLDNIDFEFMAEGPDCATSCASPLACPGTIEASGGTLVQADATYDYSLVIPDTSTASGTDLPATYGFMRLRESGAVLGAGASASASSPPTPRTSAWAATATPPASTSRRAAAESATSTSATGRTPRAARRARRCSATRTTRW
jgi:lysyl endopeptidase